MQTALEELRYGAIAVNAWSALAFTPAQVRVAERSLTAPRMFADCSWEAKEGSHGDGECAGSFCCSPASRCSRVSTVPQGHWGAWGGDQTIADVGSGIGAVHNTCVRRGGGHGRGGHACWQQSPTTSACAHISPISLVLSTHCPPRRYMFDHSQKAVVRTPFVSSLHLLPQRYSPLPLPVAKIVAGLVHGGPLGALKMWWRS